MDEWSSLRGKKWRTDIIDSNSLFLQWHSIIHLKLLKPNKKLVFNNTKVDCLLNWHPSSVLISFLTTYESSIVVLERNNSFSFLLSLVIRWYKSQAHMGEPIWKSLIIFSIKEKNLVHGMGIIDRSIRFHWRHSSTILAWSYHFIMTILNAMRGKYYQMIVKNLRFPSPFTSTSLGFSNVFLK